MNSSQFGALTLHDMLPIIEEKLASGGEVTFKPNGVSMLPLIRPSRDTVTLIKAPKALKVGDVIFYKRENGQLVLHRIIGKSDKGYVLCGDNQSFHEKYVTDEMIIGILKSFERAGGIQIKPKGILYAVYKMHLPLRRFYLRGKAFIKFRIIKKLKSIF